MEGLRGRHAFALNAAELAARVSGYTQVTLDLGTGDGRYVRALAAANAATLAIGIDACREQLRAASRSAPGNALFVIANALALPRALDGVATQVTINFPWGSLLEGLLDCAPGFAERLAALGRAGARLEVRLNAGALAEAGWELEAGGEQVRRQLLLAGFRVGQPVVLGPAELRACPSTWARRLAFGRDPRGVLLRASLGSALAAAPRDAPLAEART